MQDKNKGCCGKCDPGNICCNNTTCPNCHSKPEKEVSKEWEEEFEAIWRYFGAEKEKNVKEMLKNLITEAEERGYEKGLKDGDYEEFNKGYNQGVEKERQRVIEMVEGIRKEWETYVSRAELDFIEKMWDKKSADQEYGIQRRVKRAVIITLADITKLLEEGE